MTLKKVIPFFVLAVCLLACKKNNSNSSGNYHFTATIDGKAQTFNVSPMAVRITNGGYSIISIEGFTAASSTTQILALSWDNVPAVSSTFTTGNYSDTASTYGLSANYNPTTNESYIAGGEVIAYPTGTLPTGVNHLKITISSLDSTAVKGTFSGDFFYNADPTAAKKTITNGDFYVPWKK